MITEQLINPKSIVVVGGSNDITKPGGKVLKNIIDGNFPGDIYVTNIKEDEVQGIKSYKDPAKLPDVDLAVIAVAARFVVDIMEVMAHQKNTRAFIVLSAGFSEESEDGKNLEKQLVEIANSVNGTLIGPNCIGVLTPKHSSVFTYPIPKLTSQGCDFISGSGATACFIMEAGIPNGLTFANVFSVGNSAQVGVEGVLKYLDESFDGKNSSRVKLLYIENISKPRMLLKHASSLIRKGCRIAAVKAGSSEAGSRAASSHTGALATSDAAVDALFKKAGIVRCYGREDLISVASVFMHPPLKGNKMAVISHAGGPAVMLTDELEKGGMEVPNIDTPESQELLTHLFPGSSVNNPIDFLATGTAEQLGIIIDFVDKKFKNIDGMVVIFGTPGLFPVFNVYDILDKKVKESKKPVFAALPSVMTAKKEVDAFISKGNINFPDEVVLGKALCRVFNTKPPSAEAFERPEINVSKIREIVDNSPDGYLEPEKVLRLLDASGIPRAKEAVVRNVEEAVKAAEKLKLPLAMKVIGPVHKSDVGGVILNVENIESVKKEFERLINIKDTTAVLMQPMLSGLEIFAGAKYEDNFGHMILCGMGGIFIEVLKDVSMELTPVNHDTAINMIHTLKSYDIIKGARGKEGIDEKLFADVLVRLSALMETAPEIYELDLNPLLANMNQVIAVDARINLKKNV